MSKPQNSFLDATDPFALFDQWMEEAERAEINDANAMSLATVGEDGLPDVRMILLKGADVNGFVFYTNEESDKGRQLALHPKAALCLHWKSLRRQIRARGEIVPASDEEADDYFATRSRNSQIGAWSSKQSRPFKGSEDLILSVEEYRNRFEGQEVPRPEFWKGYRIVPSQIEFWQDQPYRLHDRILFKRNAVDAPWNKERLFP